MEISKQIRRPSSRTVKKGILKKDLISFREKALELGASAAQVIPSSYVVVQERVWMKCLVPRCPTAGLTPHCPPNSPQPDFMRKVFNQYQWALLFKRNLEPVEDYVELSETRSSEPRNRVQKRMNFHKKTWEISGRLESYAQSRGYDLAMAYSAGCCKFSLCGGQPCALSQNEPCRNPFRARPSMEGVGIDVFGLAEKVGWTTYMIRRVEREPNEIPYAVSVGILFIY